MTATRAVIYARVSTAVQEREGSSLDAQVEECRRYLRSKGYRCVRIVREQVSGRKETLSRPGLLQALELLDSGRAEALCVWSLDRFSRSVYMASDLIHRYFGEGRPYKLLVATEEIDSATAAGRMILNLKLSVSQYEAERIAERIRAVKKHLRRAGLYQGGPVPYGYALGEDGVLVPEPAELAAIRAAKKLRARGLSLRQVASVLEDRGVTGRTGRRLDARQILRMTEAPNGAAKRDAQADDHPTRRGSVPRR